MGYTEIRQYVERNNEPNLSPEELDHVAMCLEHIEEWYYNDRPLGDFLTAIVRNDFTEVVFRADHINLKALKLYAWFLTWGVGADWRQKGENYGR